MTNIQFAGLSLAVVLSACATTEVELPYIEPSAETFKVTADIETPLVGSIGDSADDPAIYIHENGKGFIAGTDKQAGLYIYNLDGSKRDFFALGALNNVDLRKTASDRVVLVASNDEARNITVLSYNPITDSFDQGGVKKLPIKPSPYGICMGKVGDALHVGVTTKAGIYYQYALGQDLQNPTLDLVRQFSTRTKTEGCVFDDRTGKLYIAEEETGLYHYPADPAQGDTETTIALRGENGLMHDFEGVTIYPEGANGGYLILSSQGNNTYGLFELPSHKRVGQFTITAGAVDRVTHTDGIDVIATPTTRFPKGFFVVQDNDNKEPTIADAEEQNFKIVDWRKIAKYLK